MHSQDPVFCPDLKPQQTTPPLFFNGDPFYENISKGWKQILNIPYISVFSEKHRMIANHEKQQKYV
jgi:hypothetical protein